MWEHHERNHHKNRRKRQNHNSTKHQESSQAQKRNIRYHQNKRHNHHHRTRNIHSRKILRHLPSDPVARRPGRIHTGGNQKMVDKPRYIDVNIFIYWLGNHPKHAQAAQQWIKKIEDSQRGEYVTSSLTLYEALVILGGLLGKNLKDKDFVNQVINPITSIKGLKIEPLKSEDFKKAAEQMNECRLDYEDALHLAIATRIGAQEIISNDKDFDTTQIRRII
jgi:predicted nucleic acid-binding protein